MSYDKYVPGSEDMLYIDGLQPDTIYTFWISAKYDDGWGPQYRFDTETSKEGECD